ncbi:uncharacterized protein LOC123524023 [Mercenaria mercenaria]|uniref:uncharacterized protein LOC123524023 n=1 Tax=Mercenaria mercenaria TaxID=6596 RepID=UPI00234E6EB8|nr:uncharacterized protein LOC123524023 [Mercenaria mercenaria]
MRLPATCAVLCFLGILVTAAAETTPVQVGDMSCILNTTSNIMKATMVIYKKTASVTRAFFTKLDSYDTVYDQTGCEWTGTGTDSDPFKAEVDVDSTSNLPPSGKSGCGYEIVDAQKQIYRWTVYNQETFEMGRGEDLVFIYECTGKNSPTSVSVTIKVNTKDKEGTAVRVKPENQMSILKRSGSSSVFSQVVTDGISVGQDIKLRVQSKVKRSRQAHIDHYGVYVFSCDYRTSAIAKPVPFIMFNGCPNNQFNDLAGGFKFARYSIISSDQRWFQTETDEFKLVPSAPENDYYLVRCYLHYCYGSEGTDDKCSDYCNSNIRRRRSTINVTAESVTIRVKVNNELYIGSGNEKQTGNGEQIVIIIIATVTAVIILAVIFVVGLVCCCRRRRHLEKEWSDTSTMDSRKHLSSYPPAYQFRNPKF